MITFWKDAILDKQVEKLEIGLFKKVKVTFQKLFLFWVAMNI